MPYMFPNCSFPPPNNKAETPRKRNYGVSPSVPEKKISSAIFAVRHCPTFSTYPDFIKYIQTYYEQTDGRAYEYYGVEEEGYVQKVQLSDLDIPIYIGYKYSTTNSATSTFFISLSIVAIIVYVVILLIWSKGISKNLEEVSNNLVQIAKGKNAVYNKVLPVTSSDELRRTYCSI